MREILREGRADTVVVTAGSGPTRPAAAPWRPAWTTSVNGSSRPAPCPQESQVTSGDFNADGKEDVAALHDAGKSADGKFITSLFTLTSNGTDIKAPAKHWNGSLVQPTGSVVKCHAHACAGGQRGDLTLHLPPRQAGGLLMRSYGRLSIDRCTVN